MKNAAKPRFNAIEDTAGFNKPQTQGTSGLQTFPVGPDVALPLIQIIQQGQVLLN